MRYSARFLLAVKKKIFKCARAMARIVKLLWHDVSCPITSHCTKSRNWNDLNSLSSNRYAPQH